MGSDHLDSSTTNAQSQPYPEWALDAQWTLVRALEHHTTVQLDLVLAQIRCWTLRQRMVWRDLIEPTTDASTAAETSIVEELEAAEAALDTAEAAVCAWAHVAH